MGAAPGGAWVNRTQWRVSMAEINGSTPGEIFNAISVEHSHSPVLIGIVATFPPCGLSGGLKVANKWQSTSPGSVGSTQKLDTVVDENFPDDLDYASIFNKVIGHKLSDSFSNYLYSRFRMNFAGDFVQTQAPQFMDLGLPDINTFN